MHRLGREAGDHRSVENGAAFSTDESAGTPSPQLSPRGRGGSSVREGHLHPNPLPKKKGAPLSPLSLRNVLPVYRRLSLRFFSAFLWWLINRRFLLTWRSVRVFFLPSKGFSPPRYSIRIGVPTSLSTRR